MYKQLELVFEGYWECKECAEMILESQLKSKSDEENEQELER
jgi:hypothetical protein